MKRDGSGIPHTPGVAISVLDADTIGRFLASGHPRTVGVLLKRTRPVPAIFTEVAINRLTVDGKTVIDYRSSSAAL